MIRLPTLTPRQILIMLHDVVATAAALVLTFVMRFEEPQLSAKLAALPYLPLFLALRGGRLFRLRHAPQQVALHVAAGPLQHLPRQHGAGRHAARRRLRPGRAQRLWPLLLRQDHHPAVLVPADILPGRLAGRLPLFPLHAHDPARAGRRRHTDPGARPRRRRGSAAARDRKRRGQEDLDRRRAVALARRPRAVDPRRAGARRRRRPGNGGRRSRRPRHAGRPPGDDALGAVAGCAPGIDPGARPQARLDGEPAAVARFTRPGHAARAGGGGGPAAAAEREHRLPAAGELRQRQVGGGDRRRRFDRLGDLRPAGHLRRRPPAGHRKFRAGAARGAGSAERQAVQGRDCRAHRRRARPRPHHEPDRRNSSPTSSSTPPRSSTCPCSNATGTKPSRPTCSAR